MKQIITPILFYALLMVGCKKKDVAFYKSEYIKNRTEYFSVATTLNHQLAKDSSLFKFMVEFTGKRFVEYTYKDEFTIHFFEGMALSDLEKYNIENVMYRLNLLYIIAYRDSTAFVFGGMHKDIIVHYKQDIRPKNGHRIDTNTYLFFEGTR